MENLELSRNLKLKPKYAKISLKFDFRFREEQIFCFQRRSKIITNKFLINRYFRKWCAMQVDLKSISKFPFAGTSIINISNSSKTENFQLKKIRFFVFLPIAYLYHTFILSQPLFFAASTIIHSIVLCSICSNCAGTQKKSKTQLNNECK